MENQGVQPSLTFQSSELKASNIFFFFLKMNEVVNYWNTGSSTSEPFYELWCIVTDENLPCLVMYSIKIMHRDATVSISIFYFSQTFKANTNMQVKISAQPVFCFYVLHNPSKCGLPSCQCDCLHWLEAGIAWEVQLETEIALRLALYSEGLPHGHLPAHLYRFFKSSSHLFPPP